MNINEFISSGILELYANGLTSPEENREVEIAVANYPDVKNELIEIQESLALMASVNYRKAGPELLERIMDRIDEEEDKVVPFVPPAEVENKESGSIMRYLAIAAGILLLGSLVFNFILYNDLTKANKQIASLNEAQQVIAGEIDILKTSNTKLNEGMDALLYNTDFNEIVMDDKTAASLIGKVNQEGAKAIVRYNPKTSDLFVFSENLQVPPEGYQYQLWAVEFVDGAPIPTDAGVFDVNGKLQAQKKISGTVHAFAVTLEKKGGSKSPNLGQMFVAGTT